MSQLSGGCSQPVKETGFSRVMSELNNEYEQLEERTSILLGRIEKFMLQNSPETQKENCVREAMPPAIQEIENVSQKLAGLRATVDNVISRLEV